MSESNHDTDRKHTDVAIAAESNLDREGAEHGDGSEGSVTLIMSALEKMAEATDHLAQQMNERLEGVERDIDESKGSEDSHEQLSTMQDQVREAIDAMRQAAEEQTASFSKELEALREELDHARKHQRSWLEEELRSFREEFAEFRASSEDAFNAAERDRAQRLDETLKGQRDMVADLAEGIALVQTSMEHRLTEIDEQNKQKADEDQQRWNSFTEAQDERLNSITEQTREVQELGQRLENEHGEMVRVFDQEKERAEKAADERQREQARRINNSGVARYHAGDYVQARVLFEQAVESDQLFAEAFNNLGLALTELGEHEDATVAFETAIELNPELGAGYNNLGYVLYLQENFEAAIEMYNEAIGREHDTSAAYTNLGNAWQKLNKTEKAVEAWKRALEVDPSNERAQRYLDRFAGPAA
jgi:tetratricopeptide (TPR) repeat protein